MTPSRTLRLFEGFGVELEYMIVDRDTLSVKPVTDEVLRSIAGTYESEVEMGPLSWSNELVLHVIELKTNGPAAALDGLAAEFTSHVDRINAILEPMGGCLMPTAMHPWFDPHTETRLWPHEFSPVYEAYNRIFNCQGHGWSNLQSVHLNLPFGDDEEFGRLHAAIRLVLPLLPAIAASSPIVEMKTNGVLDNRLEVYRTNAKVIPSITGSVIPEPVFSRKTYDREIFQRMFRDIAPYDPEKTLQYEFLNSRGAIARFERKSIEIRVLDIQECPAADLAVLTIIVETLKAMVGQRWISLDQQQSWKTEPLVDIYQSSVREGEAARITDRNYLEVFGVTGVNECTAGDVWRHLADAVLPSKDTGNGSVRSVLNHILTHGTLARRILRALDGDVSHSRVARTYRTLCNCLEKGQLFGGEA